MGEEKSQLINVATEASSLVDSSLVAPRSISLNPIDTHFTGGHGIFLDEILYGVVYNCKPAQAQFLAILEKVLEGNTDLARRIGLRYDGLVEKPFDARVFKELDRSDFREPKLSGRMIPPLFAEAKGLHIKVMDELKSRPALPTEVSEVSIDHFLDYLLSEIPRENRSQLKREFKATSSLRGRIELPNLPIMDTPRQPHISPGFETTRQALYGPASQFQARLKEGRIYESGHHLMVWIQGMCYYLSAELNPVDPDEILERHFSNPQLSSGEDHELPAYTARSGFITQLLLNRFFDLFPGKLKGYVAQSTDEGRKPKYPVDVLTQSGLGGARHLYIHSELALQGGKRRINPNELLARPNLLIEGNAPVLPTEEERLEMVAFAARARAELPESFQSLPPKAVERLRDLYSIGRVADEYGLAHGDFPFEQILSTQGLALHLIEKMGEEGYNQFLQQIGLEGAIARSRLLKPSTSTTQPDVWLGTFYSETTHSNSMTVNRRVIKVIPNERQKRITLEALCLASSLAPETGIKADQYLWVAPNYLAIHFLGESTREERALRNQLFFEGNPPIWKAEIEDTLKVAGSLLGRTPQNLDHCAVRKYTGNELSDFTTSIVEGLEAAYRHPITNRDCFSEAIWSMLQIKDEGRKVIDWDLTLRNASRNAFYDSYMREGTVEEIVAGVLPFLPPKIEIIGDAVKRVVDQYVNPARTRRLELLNEKNKGAIQEGTQEQVREFFNRFGMETDEGMLFSEQVAQNINPRETPYNNQFVPSHIFRSVALRNLNPAVRAIKRQGGTEKVFYGLELMRKWCVDYAANCIPNLSGKEKTHFEAVYTGLTSLSK
ncbi:MAG: hypothetical protein AABX70_08760 [Nanoarchaeota archaeon]